MIDSHEYIKDNLHRLPKEWNIDSMAKLMEMYLKDNIESLDKELYSLLIKNDLPINTISAIHDLHRNNGKLSYGLGNYPIGYSGCVHDEWIPLFKKVPRDLYNLFTNGL